MKDKKYIEELENMVCWLANCYEAAKYEFHHKHLDTCGVHNPDRRDLTESEKDEILRFPKIQGSGNLFLIAELAKTKRKPSVPLRDLRDKIIKSSK